MDDEELPELDASTSEPPVFGEARASVLTPEGEIQSIGSFARGLRARRVKIAIFSVGALLMLIALFNALQ